jgi:transcriptional regulator with XRE-family HTH domain
MRLRNRVRAVRAALGLSQRDLAKLSGVSRVTLGAIERDDGYEPKASVMGRVCEVLGDAGLWWFEPSEEVA